MSKAKKTRGQLFTEYVLSLIESDNAARGMLSRADNSGTEYQSWEYLVRFGVDLEQESQRIPFTLIAAALAKGRIKNNGTALLGEALAGCYSDGNRCDQAKAKMLRLLACESVQEVCLVLRPFLQFIAASSLKHLNYGQLLDDLLRFNRDSLKIKASWAKSFYFSREVFEEEI